MIYLHIYCLIWGMVEKPSPSGEGVGLIILFKIGRKVAKAHRYKKSRHINNALDL